MWRWGTSQNFCLAFIDEKQLLKKLLKWANEKCKNFNIYNVAFFLKKWRKTAGDSIILHFCIKNLDLAYSSRDIVWQTEIGNYG